MSLTRPTGNSGESTPFVSAFSVFLRPVRFCAPVQCTEVTANVTINNQSPHISGEEAVFIRIEGQGTCHPTMAIIERICGGRQDFSHSSHVIYDLNQKMLGGEIAQTIGRQLLVKMHAVLNGTRQTQPGAFFQQVSRQYFGRVYSAKPLSSSVRQPACSARAFSGPRGLSEFWGS